MGVTGQGQEGRRGRREAQLSNNLTKEGAMWVLLGEGSKTRWVSPLLVEGLAGARANCMGRREEMPCP